MKQKSRSTRRNPGSLRVHHEHPHHAHRHLHHFVGMGVVHEGAALLQLELVDEGLARLDMRLGQAADAVHAVRHDHAVPMHRGVLGEFVGDEDADLVALDRLDGRARCLAVIAPQIDGHAGSEFAHDRLGDEMELLPGAVHAPGQRPAVERHHRLIVLAALRRDRRLHRRGAEWSAPRGSPQPRCGCRWRRRLQAPPPSRREIFV